MHVSRPVKGAAPVTACFSAAAIALCLLLVFADQDPGVREIGVGRDLEIVRGGLVLVDPTRKVEKRSVARTIEPSGPLALERLGTRFELILRRAAEVRANSDYNQILRLDRAVFVPGVFRRQLAFLALALGVGDLAVGPLDLFEHFLGAMKDPDRLAAPLDGHLFPGIELADFGLDGRAERYGALRGQHRCGEGDGCGERGCTARTGTRDDQAATLAVDPRLIAHGETLTGKGIVGESEIIQKASRQTKFFVPTY